MLENEEFWKTLLGSSDDSSTKDDVTSTDPTLYPGDRAGNKPTTLDPHRERSLDIDALLEDIHKKVAAKVRAASDVTNTPPTVHFTGNSSKMSAEKSKTPVSKTDSSSVSPTDEKKGPVTNRAVTPPNTTPPASSPEASSKDNSPDDNQAMREMTAAMRELTAELRQFRAQMGHPVDADHPQGIPVIPEKLDHLGETPVGTTDIYFSGFVLDGHRPSEEPKAETVTKDVAEKKKTNKALNIISNVLFYVVIVAMVLGAFLFRSTSKGQPFMLGGISVAHVLTSSMEDVYPRGSLIITRAVDPSELKIGDDITFMVSEDTSITHRIIKVSKDPVSGDYMFTTKGTNNQKADEDPVSQTNVVGKVIFASKALGDIANFVKTNWPILIFVLIVIIGLISFLKWNAKNDYGEEDEEEKKEEKPKAKKEKTTSHTKKRHRPTERRGVENDHEES